MSRARRELDRLCDEAWSDLAARVRLSGARLSAGVKKHPVLVLGTGALLAALAFRRRRRPAPQRTRKPAGLAGPLFQSGFAWLLRELSAVSSNGRHRT